MMIGCELFGIYRSRERYSRDIPEVGKVGNECSMPTQICYIFH